LVEKGLPQEVSSGRSSEEVPVNGDEAKERIIQSVESLDRSMLCSSQ